ncbi:MAG: hypothetical protein ACAH80_12090 [Alphaproteobacteria bacterium]
MTPQDPPAKASPTVGPLSAKDMAVPNYTLVDPAATPRFDSTLASHEAIREHNARVQRINSLFDNYLRQQIAAPDRAAQIAGLKQFGWQPLYPKHILQVAQELSLRDAHDDALTFLADQKKLSARAGTAAFFNLPEAKLWEAGELYKAGRPAEAIALAENVLAADPRNTEALRTRAMAQAGAAGPDRAAALKAFAGGFADTGDYSLGMGAVNAALETGDIAQAKKLAPLVSLAAQNIGADQSKSFWPAVVAAQAAAVNGDPAAMQQTLLHLEDVLQAKNPNKTPIVSTDDKMEALGRISRIINAQPDKPEVKALLQPVAERLEMALGHKAHERLTYKKPVNTDTIFAERGYHSRQGLTAEGFEIRGNVRVGSMLPDSITTKNDKAQFLEVTETPLKKFIDAGLFQQGDLPAGVNTSGSLSAIADLETRIKATQAVVRGIFDVDERNLENLHGLDHRIYDSVVRLRLEHSGATAGRIIATDDERAAYASIKSDQALYDAAKAGTLSPTQVDKLSKMPAIDQRIMELGITGAAKEVIGNVELFRTSDTRTNIAVTSEQSIGDCRHVAAATEALVAAVQQNRTTEHIQQAAMSLSQGDEAGYRRFMQRADAEINSYEMRVYDQSVKAAVEVKKTYEPVLTADGKFVAAATETPQLIEYHMHNVLRTGEGAARKFIVADSFYQKGPYRMGWVENSDAKVVPGEEGMNMLQLQGGEIEAVVCERRADGTLEMKGDHPVPKLGADGKPVTVKRPLVLESTKYSSPGERLHASTPQPSPMLGGSPLGDTGMTLAQSLQNPDRPASYARLAKFVVDNHQSGKINTPELPATDLPAAQLRVADINSPAKINSIPMAEIAPTQKPVVLDYESVMASAMPEESRYAPKTARAKSNFSGPGAGSVIMGLGSALQAAGQLAGPEQMTSGQKVMLVTQTTAGLVQTGLEFVGPSMTNVSGGYKNFTGIGNNIKGTTTGLGRVGGGLGALGGGFGMYSSAVGFHDAIKDGNTTGAVLSGGNFVASSAFAVAGVAQVLGRASLATNSTGVGVCIGVPLQVIGLGFQIYDIKQQSDYMEALMNSRLADETQQSRGGFQHINGYIPGIPLKPEFADYKGLLSLQIELRAQKTTYDNGKPVSLEALANNPSELKRIAAFAGDQYDTGVKNRQWGLDEMASWRHSSTLGQFSDYLRRELRGIDDQAIIERTLQDAERRISMGTAGRGALQDLDAGGPSADKSKTIGYNWRLQEYRSKLAPVEKQYPDQVAQLERLRGIYAGIQMNRGSAEGIKRYSDAQARENVIAERAKVEAMEPTQQEAYFQRNKEFLEKASIDGSRPDLAYVALSASREQYEAKALHFAPAVFAEKAQAAIEQNRHTLDTVAHQGAALAARAEALAKALPDTKPSDMPVIDDKCQPVMKDGQPLTFRAMQDALAAQVKEAQAKAGEMEKGANDPDAKARLALQQVNVQTLQMQIANNENQNLAFRLQAYDRDVALRQAENTALRQGMAAQGLDKVAVTPDAAMTAADKSYIDSQQAALKGGRMFTEAEAGFNRKFGDAQQQAALLQSGDPAYVAELEALQAMQFNISLAQIGSLQAENAYLKNYQTLAQTERTAQLRAETSKFALPLAADDKAPRADEPTAPADAEKKPEPQPTERKKAIPGL